MIKVLSWIWQLPQNIIGLIVIFCTRAEKRGSYYAVRYNMGVSLGEYRIIRGNCPVNTELHEYGHTRQSRMLGVLYLIVIGLPSVTGNIYDRIAHRNWTVTARIKWYYSQPWEHWADTLGGVERF